VIAVPVSSSLLNPDGILRSISANPSLYQINTRVLLTSLSHSLRRPATLDDIPDEELDRVVQGGFDWVWFLGIWQTGPAGRTVSLAHTEWLDEFESLLPDFSVQDVCGSCFAIRSYTVNSAFGGNAALIRLRERLAQRGIRLMLDFVPNHTAPDHPWVEQHPEFYVHGTAEQLAREPQNYTRIGSSIMAYGRDPYFAGWPDTLQLNYAEPALQEVMASTIEGIAGMCDGVRCDMAMLILPNVFEKTWGLRPASFWPMAINRGRTRHANFLFMAEVYWDLEWTLQQQGFDYTYDKRLYDRLRAGHASPVRDHFRADLDFQHKSARFLENHDEPRAADTFPLPMHKAAAVLTFLCPGLRFIHQGQMEGFTKRIPVHLSRGPEELANVELHGFYQQLLNCLRHPASRDGEWSLLECTPAWDGNWTAEDFICFAWRCPNQKTLIVVVNYAPNQSQGYLRIPFESLVTLRDLLGPAVYERNVTQGLYLDLPGWGYHVFELIGA
jgi:hypothetical protein